MTWYKRYGVSNQPQFPCHASSSWRHHEQTEPLTWVEKKKNRETSFDLVIRFCVICWNAYCGRRDLWPIISQIYCKRFNLFINFGQHYICCCNDATVSGRKRWSMGEKDIVFYVCLICKVCWNCDKNNTSLWALNTTMKIMVYTVSVMLGYIQWSGCNFNLYQVLLVAWITVTILC